MNIFARFEKKCSVWFLIAVLFGFFLLRLPSLFEPYWYGDEGVYEVIGFALRHGRYLYQGIWDNKPPLLYLLYALFDGNQGGAKFLSLLVGLLAVFVFFLLAKKLFQKDMPVFITTEVFALLLASPLLEGNIANAENFMILPTLIAGYMIITSLTRQEISVKKLEKAFFFAGLLLGISFLLKVVAVFDLGAFGLFAFFLLYRNKSSFFISILKLIPLGIGFAIPAVLTVGYFAYHHLLAVFIHSTLSSNVSYVNYGNQFIIPQGFLILKLIILAIICFVVFLKREKLSTVQLFVFLWLPFSIFDALFSGRTYTHYTLVIIGSLSLALGLILTVKKFQKIYLVGLVVLLVFLFENFTLYSRTIPYYRNFLMFMSSNESVLSYRTFFDQASIRDYDIVVFYNKHKKPGDTLFIWGNDGQIYKLANTLPVGRYIVAYHMTMTPSSIKETQSALIKHPPTFIAILPGQPALPVSLENYSEIVILDSAVIYERNF